MLGRDRLFEEDGREESGFVVRRRGATEAVDDEGWVEKSGAGTRLRME